MTARNRVLHRRQLAIFRKPFDRDDVCAVELKEKVNARVDRSISEAIPFAPSDQHGACSAIALLADDLRTRGSLVIAQEPRQRLKRQRAPDAVRHTVDVDEDEVAHEPREIVPGAAGGYQNGP